MKENKETIINFADTYFWDVFAVMATGFIIYTEIDLLTSIEKYHWFTYLFLFYVLGLIGDGLLGLLPIEKFFRSSSLESEVKKKFEEMTQLSAESKLAVKIRNYLEIHHVPHRYLTFYSKHRLYRNLGTVSLLNIFFTPIIMLFPNLFDISIKFGLGIFLITLFILISFAFYWLASKFWVYATDKIYMKFLISTKKSA